MREEKSSQDKSFKRFFKKRWVYPAVYLASAAIILTGVLWFQNSGEEATDQFEYETSNVPGKQINDQPAIEVNRSLENFVMPVTEVDNAVVKMQFYDNDSDKAEQEAALVVYNNQYHPNTGIDIADKDGKEFDVVASLTGKVTVVKEDSLLGNVIEIEHDNGIVTQYQSIKNMKVKAGDMVGQGDTIATAGTSMFNEKAGVHVHFEIRKDNIAVNPIDYLDKPLSALEEAEISPENNAGKDQEGSQLEEGTETGEDTSKEEETPTDEGKPAEEGTPDEDKDSTDDSEKDEDTSSDSTDSSNS